MDTDYIGSKEEEMDAEGRDVDEEQKLCLQCEQRPRVTGRALCEHCLANIPF